MNKFRAIVLSITLVVCASALPSGTVYGTTLMPLMKSQKELEGNWLGGQFDREMARLSINSDGTGSLRVQWLSGAPVRVYQVSRARLRGGAIDFVVIAKGKSPPVSVTGAASTGQITLELKPLKGEWSTKIVLWREATVLSRIRAVADSASKLHP